MSDITGHRFGDAVVDGELAAQVREETARHWKLLLAIGILCDVAGVYSIFVPIVASISAAVLVGWALLFAGIVEFGHVLRRELALDMERRLDGARVPAHDRGGRVDPDLPAGRDDHPDGGARGLVLGDRRFAAAHVVEDSRARAQLDDGLNGALSLALGILIWASFPARRPGPSGCWSASS